MGRPCLRRCSIAQLIAGLMRSAPLPCGRSCAANAARFHLGAVQRKPVQGSQDACLHFDGRDAGRACNAQAARKGELLPHGAPWHFEWRSFKKGTQSSGRKRGIVGRAFCAEQTASIWPSRKLPRTGLAAVHRVTLLRTSSYYTEPTSLVPSLGPTFGPFLCDVGVWGALRNRLLVMENAGLRPDESDAVRFGMLGSGC